MYYEVLHTRNAHTKKLTTMSDMALMQRGDNSILTNNRPGVRAGAGGLPTFWPNAIGYIIMVASVAVVGSMCATIQSNM